MSAFFNFQLVQAHAWIYLIFFPDGTDDGLHGEAERSAVQRQGGERSEDFHSSQQGSKWSLTFRSVSQVQVYRFCNSNKFESS